MDVVSSIGHLALLICIFGQIHSLPSTVVRTPNFHYYSKLQNLLAFYRDKNRRCDDRKIFRFNPFENDLIINLTKNTKLGRFLTESNLLFDYQSDDVNSLRNRLISSMDEDTLKLIEIAIISRSIDKLFVQGFKKNALGRIDTFENYSVKKSDWETDGENLHICRSNLHDCILSSVDYGNNADDGASTTELLYRTNCGDQIDNKILWEVIFVQKMRRRNLQKKAPVVNFVYMILLLSSLELNQCDNDVSQSIKMNICPEATKCIFIPGAGFSIDSYLCCCHSPSRSPDNFFDENHDRSKFCLNGSMIADLQFKDPEKPTDFVHYCRYPRSLDARDHPVFTSLVDRRMTITSANATSFNSEVVDSSMLRKILFSINILCGLFAFVLIFVAISHRRTQDWSARGWALMELFFLGAILLYLIVVLDYFEARDLTCCLSIWCREIGFALFYGPIILKIYRNLIEHRVRTCVWTACFVVNMTARDEIRCKIDVNLMRTISIFQKTIIFILCAVCVITINISARGQNLKTAQVIISSIFYVNLEGNWKKQYFIEEYLVRKAHHVFVKEKDLLKYLAFVAVFTFIGLLAFTLTISDASSSSIFSTTTILAGDQSSTTATSSATMINKRWLIEEPTPTKQFVERRTFPLVSVGLTSPSTLDRNGGVDGVVGRRYFVCTIFKWNFAWQGLELILLLYGCYLTYKARNTSWVERKQFGFSVLSEMLVTTVISSVRYNLWLTTSPNTLLLLSFVQVHCTVTLSIAVILASKLYYANTDHSNRDQSLMSSGTSRAHPSLAKLRDNLVNGAIDFAEVPITEMNPEDIKAELKRVYTQLRMYKLTNLYADNPHISKRKGGKKSSSKQQQQQNQQGRRISLTGASTNANSSATKKKKDHFKNKFEMEEKSSLAKANDDDSASVGSVHDLTVQSSMHNVYLSRTSLAAAKKLQLDSDLSVRI